MNQLQLLLDERISGDSGGIWITRLRPSLLIKILSGWHPSRWSIVVVAALLFLQASFASVVFQDDFNLSVLDGSKWRRLAPVQGTSISLTGTSVIVPINGAIDTCGKVAFSGSDGIVVEARFRGGASGHDARIGLRELSTGDTIAIGETNSGYIGLYMYGTGQFSTAPGYYVGGATDAYKEYRFTLTQSLAIVARGDTLETLNEFESVPLPSSVSGKNFYLSMATGFALDSSEFDWVRINGTLVAPSANCTSAGLIEPVIESVEPSTTELNSPTVFTVRGTNLDPGLGFSLTNCTPSNLEQIDSETSQSLRKFRCTPRGYIGLQYGRVLTAPFGALLKQFQLHVVASTVDTDVSSLSFDSPITAQIAGQAFPVRIRAMDAGGSPVTAFNGAVSIGEIAGKSVSPSTVRLTAGEWTGSVVVRATGEARLVTQYVRPDQVRVTGQSNSFAVTSSTMRPTFSITGTTLPTVDAVRLLLDDGQMTIVRSTSVDTDGRFSFTEVPRGKYALRVLKAGFRQLTGDQPFELNGHYSSPPLTLQESTGRYALLLPGMMGSTLRQSYIEIAGATPTYIGGIVQAPAMAPTRACDDNSAKIWAPRLDLYYPNLAIDWPRVTSQLQGRGFMVGAVPWDWRCSATQAAEYYLKPVIAQIKALEPTAEIFLVAHSMGGLVARYYIQTTDFAANQNLRVNGLVMLGTPNLGSTKAYYLMEGADFRLTDDFAKPIYEKSVESLYKTANNGRELANVPSKQVRAFIRENVLGGLDLMPSYAFLQPGLLTNVGKWICQAAPGQSPHGASAANLFLSNLNANATTSRYIQFSQAPTGNQVRTKLFLSNSKSTDDVVTYCSTNRPEGVYPDGLPSGTTSQILGDGTVKAQAPLFLDALKEVGKFGDHTDMVGATAAQVAQLLASVSPSASVGIGRAPAATTRASTAATSGIRVATAGDVDIQVQLPNGVTVGTSETGIVTEISGVAEVINYPHARIVNLYDPAVGRYSVSLRSAPELTRTVRTAAFEYGVAATGVSTRVEVRYLVGANPRTVSWDFIAAPDASISIAHQVAPPGAVVASRQPDGTRLTWTAAADPLVTGYRIYRKPAAEATYDLLGSTASTTYDTGVPWASSEEDMIDFVVVSVNAAGDESLLPPGDIASNRGYIVADFTVPAAAADLAKGTTLPVTLNFTDASRSSAAVTDWQWDLDGDGQVDSTAQNPAFTYSAYGKYTISLDVAGIEGEDGRIKTFAVTVAPCAPLQLATSCSLDVNGDGVVDARDGTLILRRMLGFTGSGLTEGLVTTACRTAGTADTIAAFVDDQVTAGRFNVDGAPGNGGAASNGLLIYRALTGLTGDAVTANVVRPGAVRSTWEGASQIREYLNSQCGARL